MKKKLCEIGKIIAGGTPSTKINEYWNGKISWITPKDLSNYKERFISKGERSITEDGLNNSSAVLMPKNSILFTSRAPIGYVAIAEKELCTNQGFKSFVCNEQKCYYKYMYYWFLNNVEIIKSKANGSTFQEISGAVMKNIEIELPDMKTQINIGNILDTIDEKIEVNNHINDNLLDIANELLKTSFKKIKDRETLSNIIKFVKGKKPNNISKFKQERYEKYLTIACLNLQELNYADKEKTVIADNDLLMVMDGASSGSVYYSDYGIVGSTLARLDITNNQYVSEFIYFVLKYYNNLIQSKNTGSAIPHTDKVFVGTLEVPKINIEQQKVFEILLAKIQKNNQQNETLSQLRDTLLPKLMNGEINLDKIEI